MNRTQPLSRVRVSETPVLVLLGPVERLCNRYVRYNAVFMRA